MEREGNHEILEIHEKRGPVGAASKDKFNHG